jgi:hypothetical protein
MLKSGYVREKGKYYFHRRDCHGRTILHRFILQLPNDLLQHPIFQHTFTRLLDMTSIPMDAADNQGETISDVLLARGASPELHRKLFDKCWSTLASALTGSRQFTVTERIDFLTTFNNKSMFDNVNLVNWLTAEGDINWIDHSGDTIPITLIKFQKENILQSLRNLISRVAYDADLSIKNKKGNTVLAVAVYSGDLTTTLLLLEAGANVHSRNYSGLGILLQAAEEMRQAKQGENRVLEYNILGCANKLTDCGALIHPTDMDEWMTLEGKGKAMRKTLAETEAKTYKPNTSTLMPMSYENEIGMARKGERRLQQNLFLPTVSMQSSLCSLATEQFECIAEIVDDDNDVDELGFVLEGV